MAGRSTIEQDPRIEEAVTRALASGLTIDQIVDQLGVMGADHVSRSSVGRYAKKYRKLADRQRDMATVASAWGRDFGEGRNEVGKLLLNVMTSLAARTVMDLDEEGAELDGEELHFFARALKDLMSAAKLDTERDEKVRQATLNAAIASVKKTGKRAGATPETIAAIERELIGLKS